MATLDFIAQEALFASPLFCFRLPEAEALNALLLAETAARRATSAGMQRSNQGGWHSEDDLFTRPEPGTARLAAFIRAATLDATHRIAPKFDPATAEAHFEGWINVNGPGAYNAPHAHPAWAWSGTYYVAIPEGGGPRSGLIEFLDPRGEVGSLYPPSATGFHPKAQLRPKAGDLIIFPSYLKHWVYPNEAPGERVSIAFNARVRS